MTLSRLAKQDVSQAVKTGLVYFSAVHLATTEFIRNALPSADIVVLPQRVLVNALLLFHIIPFILLLAADWIIRRRLGQEGALKFRVAVLAAAVLLLLRQAQLFFGPFQSLSDRLEQVTPILLTLLVLALCAGVVYVTVKLTGPIRAFFLYFSPVAIFFSLQLPFYFHSENQRYANYSAAEVAPASTSLDPVFIVVFDELSYSVLLDDTGEVDAARYPNFARLASESLHLTNATSNYFHTWVAVPELIDDVLRLSTEYEVRLYEQTHRIAAIYADGCGKTYTCRDVNYVRMRHEEELTLNLAARALYTALPSSVESLGRDVLHPLFGRFDTLSPSSDPFAVHVISAELLSLYLNDITAAKAGGRVFMVHTLVPHFPYVFDGSGELDTDDSIHFDYETAASPSQETIDRIWPHYESQVEYADRFLGDLLAILDREGLYDRSTVVVTSDHGLRQSYPRPDQPIDVPKLTPNVPMFIHSPGVPLGKSNIDYQHVDFGATLYEVLGFQGPGLLSALEGLPGTPISVSALSPERPRREKVFFADYKNEYYWRYVYDAASDSWLNQGRVDRDVGDRTKPRARR